MKTYRELNLQEKSELEEVISEVVQILPKDNSFFESEKKNDDGITVLKTKQDYNEDKNAIIQLIEEKRKYGTITKDKSKQMKIAISILFNEFIRISPRKIYQTDSGTKKEEKDIKIGEEVASNMKVANLYTKIHGTYIKLPEKILYKISDKPENDEMQTLQYVIVNDEKLNSNKNEDISQPKF